MVAHGVGATRMTSLLVRCSASERIRGRLRFSRGEEEFAQADEDLQTAIAVGMLITEHPPHRSRRAYFTHRAPTWGI